MWKKVSHIHQGKMVDQQGLDKEQTIFLDLLVAAYEASGDQEFLQAAEDLGQRIIEEGELRIILDMPFTARRGFTRASA